MSEPHSGLNAVVTEIEKDAFSVELVRSGVKLKMGGKGLKKISKKEFHEEECAKGCSEEK